MKILLVYDSMYGNTEKIAQTIGSVLGAHNEIHILRAADVKLSDLANLNLLVVGGPTQRHRISEPLATMLKVLPRGTLNGVKVATFDTRYRMAAWLSGSAAEGIAKKLRKLGGHLVVPAQSFFIERDVPPEGQKRRHAVEHLESGELERAAQWADACLTHG